MRAIFILAFLITSYSTFGEANFDDIYFKKEMELLYNTYNSSTSEYIRTVCRRKQRMIIYSDPDRFKYKKYFVEGIKIL